MKNRKKFVQLINKFFNWFYTDNADVALEQSTTKSCDYESELEDLPAAEVSFEKVPDYIPDYCKMLIIKPNSLEFLDEEESSSLKQYLIRNCLCSNSNKPCPLGADFQYDVNLWFDDHLTKLKEWTFNVKYICTDSRHYHTRHYHSRYTARQNADDDFQLKTKEEEEHKKDDIEIIFLS